MSLGQGPFQSSTLFVISLWGSVQSGSSVVGVSGREHLCALMYGSTLGQRSGKGEVTVLERDFLEEVGLESGLKTQKEKGLFQAGGSVGSCIAVRLSIVLQGAVGWRHLQGHLQGHLQDWPDAE